MHYMYVSSSVRPTDLLRFEWFLHLLTACQETNISTDLQQNKSIIVVTHCETGLHTYIVSQLHFKRVHWLATQLYS